MRNLPVLSTAATHCKCPPRPSSCPPSSSSNHPSASAYATSLSTPATPQKIQNRVAPSPPVVSTPPPTSPPRPVAPSSQIPPPVAHPPSRVLPTTRQVSLLPFLRKRIRKSPRPCVAMHPSRPSSPSESHPPPPVNSNPIQALPTITSRQLSILNFLATQPTQEPDHAPPPPPEPPPPRLKSNLLDYFR